MIEASEFIERTRERGFGLWSGVPCSFLTPLIDGALAHSALRWVMAANEGDAVATAAGAALAGMGGVALMQNSGLGNAVNPLASLTHTARIPLLLVVTLRGEASLRDEPQHALMGAVTTHMLELLEIPWEPFPSETSQIDPALERACAHLRTEARPYALLMHKGSVAPGPGAPKADPRERRETRAQRVPPAAPAARPTRSEALRRMLELTPEHGSVVVATTGYTGRELAALEDRANQLYMVGSMGCAASLGLGIALARPQLRVVVIDGDGAALMRLGSFATLGAYAGRNLIHLLLDNEVHDSTGGQPTVSRGLSFAGIAAACGYGVALEGEDLRLLDALFAARGGEGPRFGALKIRVASGSEPPRPRLSPEQVRRRFAEHLEKLGGGSGALR